MKTNFVATSIATPTGTCRHCGGSLRGVKGAPTTYAADGKYGMYDAIVFDNDNRTCANHCPGTRGYVRMVTPRATKFVRITGRPTRRRPVAWR